MDTGGVRGVPPVEGETISQPTTAVVLAAGLGTRLGSLTESVPKCMTPIGGKPLLEYTLVWLRNSGVEHIIINLHHLPHVVTGYFGEGRRWGVRITYSPEEEILGTAGAVKKAASLVGGPFFVWYGDNLSTCRLDRLWQFHQAKGGYATVALHYRDDPAQSGMVELDDEARITAFVEKPAPRRASSHWVNAGILAVETAVVDEIASSGAPDFGRDVFPALLTQGRALYGYRMSEDEGIWWIDTPEDLAHVRAEWRILPEEMRP